jgi:hypothetical protein
VVPDLLFFHVTFYGLFSHGHFLQPQGTVFSARSPHPEPPIRMLASNATCGRPHPRARQCLVHPSSRSPICFGPRFAFFFSLLRTCVPLLAPLATLQLFGTLTSAGNTKRTTCARVVHSVRYPSKPWGPSAPVPCSASAKPHCAFPARAPACRMLDQCVPPAISHPGQRHRPRHELQSPQRQPLASA